MNHTSDPIRYKAAVKGINRPLPNEDSTPRGRDPHGQPSGGLAMHLAGADFAGQASDCALRPSDQGVQR
jgi:hypothetical protein